MQTVWVENGSGAERIDLPAPDEEVIDGVLWGRPDTMNTPAYWAIRCRRNGEHKLDFTSRSGSLYEEVGFCLLGGFGIKYEANRAAFERLKCEGVFEPSSCVEEDQIRSLLSRPLLVGGRMQRYRFPNQRAKRLIAMRSSLNNLDLKGLTARALRDKLMGLDGVGPKTASWIVRNMLGSDEVAIIDIHILRACKQMRVFPDQIILPRDYNPLEDRFLAFADAIAVRASILDAVMWTEMRP